MDQRDKYCDEYIQNVVSRKDYIKVREALHAGESVMPADKRDFDDKQSTINHYQAIKDRVDQFRQENRHHLGSIFAASGERVKASVTMPSIQNPECDIDWALLEVLHHRMGDNDIFGLGPNRGIPLHMQLWGSVQYCLPPGLSVYKCVQDANNTEGIYHGLLTAHVSHELINGIIIPKCTWAHTITGLMTSNSCQAGFWVPGESGAVVTDKVRNVLGFLIGGNERSPVSYFTHVDDLFDDGKQVTGAVEVRLMQKL
ncbi:hypothetical protein SI65_10317 [Aspergillus cristatus]|uniref:Uncharacterized protein n=1 Tax=Aspergillus cristatus TaxID=573508 RepID=A0A1E3B007_ASPCR|nr:hypothetical protein SI65_10317 [Aspergillus cristatus]